jgi:hypothetical protein
MNNTRVVYLFIESVTYKKMYFGSPYFHEHEGYYHQTVSAPIWKNSFDGKGNKFIATQVAQGDFTAMKEYMPGSKDYPAMRIQPKYGNSNGYEYIYRGINGHPSSRIWK